jgi:hypothetical protein
MVSEIKKQTDKKGNNVYSIKEYNDPEFPDAHTIWPIMASDIINVLIKKGIIDENDLADIKR